MLLLAFLPLFLGRVTTEPSIDSCCNSGYEWATQKIECTHLPVLSDSKECRLTQEQCCMNQLEDLHCTTGINIANEREECETSENEANSTCEARFIKQRCCHCCLLGRMAQTQGRSCDKNMFLGYQCEQVFRACCVRGQEGLDIPNRDVSKDEANAASIPHSDNEDPYLNDRCRGGGPCNQQCSDTGISVVCSCYAGYQLQPDGFSCEDINECISGSHTCKVGQVCINLVGSFRCQREVNCGTGYELMEDNNCKDIDECATATHNCLPNFNCQNTPGSFRCRPKVQCSSGYIQDALGHCIDINECVSVNAPCPPGQTCINTEGSYTCQRHVVNCGRGYHLSADGTKCEDINECASTQNPCGEGHGCMNVPGSYKCECRIGYNFDPISRTCIDVNECRGYPGRVCAHKCENTAGSFFCSCSTGFKLALDGRSCDDVDECSNNPCSQECANVYGSYQCYCRRGYQLSDVDGITCEDIDECALPTGGHICSYRCNNVPGSFRCSCPSNGYTLAPNGRNCQDVDECVTGSHNCSDTENCFNIQGGFRCLSFDCPKNYRKTGDTYDRADTVRCIKSCRPNDFQCMANPVHTISHTVISLPTFRDFNRPEEIIFLRAITPAYSPGPQPDIIFHITEGNLRESFDIQKRYVDGMIVGVVRQVKPIVGPFHAVLKLEMNYVVGGVVSHRNIVNVNIFVSEFWF
ncbi:fibulin 1 L homeolog isoform X1 [Xenopus laevis]|uniref:Fibulin-1 n=1 Tax=Xenopus laevis TaxID=8355 RepID=A0A8J1MI53_XENLA|nr:fibulin 1 L homeolog isoform X1 [Xenopus laevis]